MDALNFIIAYICLLVVLCIAEIWILSNDKGQYVRKTCIALKNICENEDIENEDSQYLAKKLSDEMVRFYNEYVQEKPQIKKVFPNVVIWIDAIIFRIDCGFKSCLILQDYRKIIKAARDVIVKKHKFSRCEKYQQGILYDIDKLKTPENEIAVQNIINRTEEEFLRLSNDIKKNNRLNVVSLVIGIMGILVSILMAVFKF